MTLQPAVTTTNATHHNERTAHSDAHPRPCYEALATERTDGAYDLPFSAPRSMPQPSLLPLTTNDCGVRPPQRLRCGNPIATASGRSGLAVGWVPTKTLRMTLMPAADFWISALTISGVILKFPFLNLPVTQRRHSAGTASFAVIR